MSEESSIPPGGTTWEEPAVVSTAIARASGGNGAGLGGLLAAIGIAFFVFFKYAAILLLQPLFWMVAVPVVGAGIIIWQTVVHQRRRAAERTRWQVLLAPQGVMRHTNDQRQAVPWSHMKKVLLRGFPGQAHVLAGVTMREDAEWCFGIPDHATAKALAGIIATQGVTVAQANFSTATEGG